jgi:hypothetical protein
VFGKLQRRAENRRLQRVFLKTSLYEENKLKEKIKVENVKKRKSK